MNTIRLLAFGLLILGAQFTAKTSLAGVITYTVDTTSDAELNACTSGPTPDCSFRGAIGLSNTTAGKQTINFNIGAGGAQTIARTVGTWQISAPATIDATTQPGYAGAPIIQLSGNNGFATGLDIVGGSSELRGLVINGFTTHGIRLQSGSNSITNSYIGTNLGGTSSVGNGTGVHIDPLMKSNCIGGTIVATVCTPSAGDRNVISGNAAEGIRINGAGAGSSGNTVVGNYIGVAAGGATAVPNATGVYIFAAPDNVIGGGAGTTPGGACTGACNVISGNSGNGIRLGGTGAHQTTIAGNFIGLDASGTVDVGNSLNGILLDPAAPFLNTNIGTGTAGGRNVISGNSGDGIAAGGSFTDNNFIKGNYIGTGSAGNSDLGNDGHGISINGGAFDYSVGGSTAGDGNVISGNGLSGISITGSDNFVFGNLIGVGANGTSAVGNSGGGVRFNGSSSNNTIGGSGGGQANRIAFNGGAGIVQVPPLTGNRVSGNSIYSNIGLGIDMNDDGVTPNDGAGDVSPQNFPVLTGAMGSTVTGSLTSDPSTAFILEFFHGASCDPAGNGEGEVFIGQTNTSTDGAGLAAFSAGLPIAIPAGRVLTATAADSAFGVTSEFSACLPDPDGDGLWGDADAEDDGDGYTDADEALIGTEPLDQCGTDGWPSDIYDQGASANKLDVQDILSFVAPVRRLDSSPPTDPGWVTEDAIRRTGPRWDLVPGPGVLPKHINIQDILAMLGGTTGNPPMFGNARAYGRICPTPP
jgi:hypothetical protein